MRRTNLVDDVQVELLIPWASGVLQPAHGREECLMNAIIDLFHCEENVGASVAIDVGNRNAADRMQISGLEIPGINEQVRPKLTIPQIFKPVGASHDVQLSVSVQIVCNHLFTISYAVFFLKKTKHIRALE